MLMLGSRSARCLGQAVVGLLMAVAAMSAAQTGVAAEPASGERPLRGVWRNPANTVHVEMRPCGEADCGYVVWANSKAQADARRGGTDTLVGLRLLKNLKPDRSGIWRGKVFIPDLNATFGGSATVTGSDTLRVQGCVFANMVCRSQTWTRVPADG